MGKTTTLLPCPFCGGEVTLGTAESTYWIDCGGCEVSTVGGYGKAEQIAAWNARAVKPDAQSDWQKAMEWARDSLQTDMARNKKYGVETDEGIYEAETELRKFLEQLDDKGERDEI